MSGDLHNISALTCQVLALVLAHERGEGLSLLTEHRPKALLPFGGVNRIIDFPLSNCLNSEIRRIGVLTQYKTVELNNYLSESWNIFRNEFGEYIRALPASQQFSDSWYSGNANAIYQNLDILRRMGSPISLPVSIGQTKSSSKF